MAASSDEAGMIMQREAAMPTRRSLLILASATLALPKSLSAAQLPPLNVGILEFGTVGWEIETIRRLGLDTAALPYANLF